MVVVHNPTSVSISQQMVEGIRALARRDPSEWGALVEVLSGYEPTHAKSRLIAELAATGLLSTDEASDLVTVIFSVHDIAQFVGFRDLDRLLEAVGVLDEIDPGLHHRLRDRVEAVLALDAVHLRIKADAVNLEYDSIFRDCQVFVDVRPVYLESVADRRGPDAREPAGFVLTHTLKVEYQRVDVGAIHLSMDADDLRLLRDEIDLALLRDETMRRRTIGDGLPDLSPSEVETEIEP